MRSIRRALGVCPQLNTLYGEMSPAQHMRVRVRVRVRVSVNPSPSPNPNQTR